MRIAILGSGAMGMLFGGYLSVHNEVYMVDVDVRKLTSIERDGIAITEIDKTVRVFYPHAALTEMGAVPFDLVILFVKSMYSADALMAAKPILTENTYVLTLQNGLGHDRILREFMAEDRMIIGATQHNGSVLGINAMYHGGIGLTSIGPIAGDASRLNRFAEEFTRCGFETVVSDQVKRLIWKKLFTNVSGSVLSAILQERLGYLTENVHGHWLTDCLIREAVAVAAGDGIGFDVEEIMADVHGTLSRARDGYASIYADIRDGRKTEVDTISGSVVAASKANGVPAPYHEFIVELVHAMEEREV